MNEYGIAGIVARALRQTPLVDEVQECLTRDGMPYAEVTVEGVVFIVSIVKQWA
jgi:hypothetical protein